MWMKFVDCLSLQVKEHVPPPCLVLVIDENLYGLMVALSYLKGLSIGIAWRPFVGFKVIRRRICIDQSVIQGLIQRLVMWELSLLQTCLEEEDCVNIHVYLQDIILMKRVEKIQGWSRISTMSDSSWSTHTKRRRCTKRDRVISWYGKHCPLRFVY